MKRTSFTVRVGLLAALIMSLPATATAQPIFDHLKCYKIIDPPSPIPAYTADLLPEQLPPFNLAPGCLIKMPARLFCIDVEKSNVNPPPPLQVNGANARDYLCYRVTCPPVSDPKKVHVKDQFGERTIAIKPPRFVCAPAEKSCVQPPSGLVAWWPLDEVFGTAVQDLSTNNPGTTQPAAIGSGGPTSLPGVMVANSLTFNGSTQFIQVASSASLNLGTGNFSIDAWIRTSNAVGRHTIVDKRDTNPVGYSFFINNGRLTLQMGDRTGLSCTCTANNTNSNCTNYLANNVNIADGNWHFVAVSVDRVNNIGRFFLDGAPFGTFNPSARPMSLSNATQLLIGRSNTTTCSSSTDDWQGELDEVEIFDRALATSEFVDIWAAHTLGKCKPCGFTGLVCGGPCPPGQQCVIDALGLCSCT